MHHRSICKWSGRLLSATMVGVLLLQMATPVFAEKLIDRYEILFQGEAIAYESAPGCAQVLSSWKEAGYQPASPETQPICIAVENIHAHGGALPIMQVQDGQSGLYFGMDTTYVEWTFEIPQTGLYQMNMTYFAADGTGHPIQRSALLDGKSPYAEADVLELPRFYVDATDTVINSVGDEVAPVQQEIREWVTRPIFDMAGRYSQPLLWKLEAGTHTLQLSYVDQPMLLGEITFTAPPVIRDYAQVKAEYAQKGYAPAKEGLTFQAEDRSHIVGKTNSAIGSFSDGDPMTEPKGTSYRRLNAMGGYSWRTGNQEITYRFKVAHDGLYSIAFRAQQAWNEGVASYRQIMIDGEIPFEELQEYAFPSSNDWYLRPLEDVQGEPYQFYLSKGEHTLTMTVKIHSQVTEAYNKTQSIIDTLSEVYRQILLITSASPDPNYDYDLEKSVPELLDTFRTLSAEIQTVSDLVTEASGNKAAVVNNLRMVQKLLDEMVEEPDLVAKRLEDIVNGLTVLGNFLNDIQNSPLGIDSVQLVPAGADFAVRRSTVWQRLWGMLENFWISFQKDYNRMGVIVADQEITDTIDVWISRGTEWAEILRSLIDSEFTAKTGIGINLNVLPSNSLVGGSVNAMLLAITSDTAPDVALSVSVDTPVEYAIRGVTLDLTQFSDYTDVSKRFLEKSLIPLRYGGGVYGLPENINFYVMAYRKDILSNLGVPLPETWDQVFYQTLPVLYQNNMQMASPTFDMLLYQMGGEYYSKDGLRTALNEPEAYAAFEQYISLFLDLGFPISSSFYNRFRTGEMPIGIVDYTTYMQVLTAAPELAGKWGVALVPGTRQQDGTVDRTTTGLTGVADIILSDTDKPTICWEFLKWWTDEEIQLSFGTQIEGKIGASARWNSANIAAFRALPWDQQHLTTIVDSLSYATAVPSVLGGVITSRAIANAANDALYNDISPRESLEKAIETINKELERKQGMYDLLPNLQ